MADTLKDEKDVIETYITPLPIFEDEAAKQAMNEAANASAVDIVYVYGPSEELSDHDKQAEAGQYPTSCTYDSSYHNQIQSYTKKKCSENPDHLLDLIETVFREREDLGRATTPLIWIAEGSAASTLHWMLQAFDLVFRELGGKEKEVHWKENVAATYGVVKLTGERPRFTLSWFLSYAQLLCIHAMGIYDRPETYPAPSPIKYISVDLMRKLWFFVSAVLVYILGGAGVYYINRNDSYQRRCVVAGFALGFLFFQFSSSSYEDWGLAASLYIFGSTTFWALMGSVGGHWVWRKWFSVRTRDQRLRRILVQLKREARDMDKNARVVKYYFVA